MTTGEKAEIKNETAVKEEKEKTKKKPAPKTKTAPKTAEAAKKTGAAIEEKAEEKKKENDLTVTFTVEVPKEDVEKEFNEALAKYAGEIKLPGFRKGKIPVEVIKSRYKDVVKEEVVNRVIEKAVVEKIEKEDMKVISSPSVEKIDYQEGKDLKADVRVDVLPTVLLPDLESIEVEIPAAELKVEAFDEKAQIDALLEGNKKQTPVADRPIKDGDHVTFKFQSKILRTKRMTPRKETSFHVDEKGNTEILDLYKDIIGKKASDTLTIKRTYPGDYKKKPWAGQEIEHYIQIEKISEWLKPEFNSDFLQEIGFEDEESFKKKLKENYEQYNNNLIEDKKLGHMIDGLIAAVDFPLPPMLVQQEISRMLQQKQYPFDINALKDEKSSKAIMDSLKAEAEKSLRFSLVTDAIKEKFKIEATADELEKEYKNMAERNKLPVKEIRKYYMKKENAETLKDYVVKTKVTGLIKEKIKVKIKT